MDPPFDRFAAACSQLGLTLTPGNDNLLRRYAALVRDWNAKVNLISRKDTERVLSYHVIDSLAVQRLLPLRAKVADIGSGAGLPGIPLAIVRPDLGLSLVESTQKRAQFLRCALAALSIANAQVFSERAEALAPLGCDVILSRLTGPLPDTLKSSARHRTPTGLVVFYKSRNCQDELVRAGRLLAKLGLRVLRTEDVTLPFTNITRRFVVLGPSQ